MQFEEILSRFRSLGGVAENLECRHGKYGRGLFTIDPERTFLLHVPAHLLVNPQWVALDSKNQLFVRPKASYLRAEAIEFFEAYQRYFGWGDGGKDSVAQFQLALQALPPKVKNFLNVLGAEQELKQRPTTQYCLSRYFINRQIGTKVGPRLMPIAELINHSSGGLPYLVHDGVTVHGLVEDEILTRYHSSLDPFHFFMNYHFATPASSVLSCDVAVEVPEFGFIRVKRMDYLADVTGTVRAPKVKREQKGMELSFLELANKKTPLQPRNTFVNLMQASNMNFITANGLFDGLLEHNQQVLSELIQECRLHSSNMIRIVESVASFQLELLF